MLPGMRQEEYAAMMLAGGRSRWLPLVGAVVAVVAVIALLRLDRIRGLASVTVLVRRLVLGLTVSATTGLAGGFAVEMVPFVAALRAVPPCEPSQ